MSIADFIARCDRYCEERGVSRTWLSKRLFNDTYRLNDLASGGSDVGVKRLEQACADLDDLSASPESHQTRAGQGAAA